MFAGPWLWELTPQDLEEANVQDALRTWFHKVERDTGGRWPADVVEEEAGKGDITLFAVVEGGQIVALAGVRMFTIPTGEQIGSIPFCVAKAHTLELWIDYFGDLKAWMRQRGCTRIEGQFRRGFERVLRDADLTPTHTFFEGAL
jgi:hypothetical protein